MESLLGLFYSRIKGSQEDIASEGLAYILRKSKSARLALNKIIKSDCGVMFPDLKYITQNVGDKLERPDISGYDLDSKEVLIIEAKFWAPLTVNQPNEYLNRLGENGVLMFICPTLRLRNVYENIARRIDPKTIEKFSPERTSNSFLLTGNKQIIVKTWAEILGLIRVHLVQDNEQALISDIDQIIGLCEFIDSNAFIPIQSEDLSSKYAKRFISFYNIANKVVSELRKRNISDTKGLNAVSTRYNCVWYFKTRKLGATLFLNTDFWAKHADTPFWINFKDINLGNKWSITDPFKKETRIAATNHNYIFHEESIGIIFFALFPLIDRPEDEVISDLADQIIQLVDNLEARIP